MKQFKALLKKEWQTHRHSFLVPIYFALGAALIALIGIIINLVKGTGSLFYVGNIDHITQNQRALILWASSMGGTVVVGFVASLSAVFLSDALLNGGFKRRCEIFHLSQPVGFGKIVAAKFGFMYVGLWLQVLIISLVGGTIAALYAGRVLDIPFYWAYTGIFQAAVSLVLPLLFVSSLFWAFSALFKRKPFFMAVLVIAGIDIAGAILQKTSGIHIPALTPYLMKLMAVGVQMNIGPQPEAALGLDYWTAVNQAWHGIFDTYAIQRLLLSIPLIGVGSWLYLRREIS